MDTLTKEKRSWLMGRVRSSDTKPERMVRSLLHRMGFRFSLRRKDLPGSPDIVLPKHRTVVFVHGCFWHQHKGCKSSHIPKTRVAFWKKKFETNVRRDRKVMRQLRALGWLPIVIWECQVKKKGFPERLATAMRKKIHGPSSG